MQRDREGMEGREDRVQGCGDGVRIPQGEKRDNLRCLLGTLGHPKRCGYSVRCPQGIKGLLKRWGHHVPEGIGCSKYVGIP